MDGERPSKTGNCKAAICPGNFPTAIERGYLEQVSVWRSFNAIAYEIGGPERDLVLRLLVLDFSAKQVE